MNQNVCNKTYQIVPKHIKLYQNISKCNKTYQNVTKLIKTYQNISKFIKAVFAYVSISNGVEWQRWFFANVRQNKLFWKKTRQLSCMWSENKIFVVGVLKNNPSILRHFFLFLIKIWAKKSVYRRNYFIIWDDIQICAVIKRKLVNLIQFAWN